LARHTPASKIVDPSKRRHLLLLLDYFLHHQDNYNERTKGAAIFVTIALHNVYSSIETMAVAAANSCGHFERHRSGLHDNVSVDGDCSDNQTATIHNITGLLLFHTLPLPHSQG
jgi:hypothetical protein